MLYEKQLFFKKKTFVKKAGSADLFLSGFLGDVGRSLPPRGRSEVRAVPFGILAERPAVQGRSWSSEGSSRVDAPRGLGGRPHTLASGCRTGRGVFAHTLSLEKWLIRV